MQDFATHFAKLFVFFVKNRIFTDFLQAVVSLVGKNDGFFKRRGEAGELRDGKAGKMAAGARMRQRKRQKKGEKKSPCIPP